MTHSPKVFHLLLFDQQHAVSVDLPPGDAQTQVLGACRQLTDVVTAEAIRRSQEHGAAITCAAGCGACCRQIVRITSIEALALAKLVAEMPAARQAIIRARFAAAMDKLRAAGIVAPAISGQRPRFSIHPPDLTDAEWREFAHAYFKLAIACPFLEDESCGIYADRPLICREYLVTSPVRHCQSLETAQTKTVPLTMQVSERLIELIRATDQSSPPTTTLAFALEWAQAGLPAPDLGDAPSALMMLSLFCRTQ
ncbi:MAG TPA: YkgJ family cysteine cluster protein [Phycisphaerae bacterium]